MGHLAIYRKYRPTNFDEVSGQKIVVNVLKNAIKNNNISHAYLFTGPRGTGKTSVAKIFARTINCECIEDVKMCNKCNSCLNTLSKECVDIIEIDAASNNGVDEIRELKSKINIVPSYLKYKIYIIDEVHMLSIGAFNALLKTLEEPPSHVIFILATTEIQKIPSTILSRCQILEFKKISTADMKNRVDYICKKEKIKIEETAINEIISFSDGCMRDALSFLEKINAFCDGVIKCEDVRTIGGKPPLNFIDNMIKLIYDKNDDCLKKVNEAYLNDYDMIYIVEDIINKLDVMIFKEKNIDDIYINMLSKFVEIYDKMKKSSVSGKIILEIELLDFIQTNVRKNISREIFLNKVEESDVQQLDEKQQNDRNLELNEEKTSKTNFNFVQFKNIRTNNTFVNADKEKLLKIKNNWNALNSYAFDKENGSFICTLLDGMPVAASNEYLIISYQYISVADNINENYLNFENILKKYLLINYNIVALTNEEWNIAKKEYINKINQGCSYNMMQDIFCIKLENVQKEEIQQNENLLKSIDNKEEKILELFDIKDVEMK